MTYLPLFPIPSSSFFFGPLFRRTIRKVKKFLKPATDHAFVRGIVGGVQNVGNIAQGAAGKAGSLATTVAATGAGAAKSAAKTAAKGVKKAASVARGNQVVPILSEEDRERLEFEQEARKSQVSEEAMLLSSSSHPHLIFSLMQREQQRVSEEAMLDQAVKEHIRAQEEEDDANFEKALADVGPDKDGSRGLDPELAGSDKSIKLAPKLTGIFFMPKFSEAIAQVG